MLLIYSNHITPRLQYIIKTLFADAIELTTNKENFNQYPGTKINYSSESLGSSAFHITPHNLLLETEITEQEINCFEWNGLKVFFKTGGDIPFDIFAASFYLLSRYEEYLPHQKDEYGRYAHSNSLAYKESFLRLPLVNLWLRELNIQYSIFNIQSSTFKYIPSYDIDIAFAYRHQPLWLNILGFYKDLFVGNFEKFMERGNVYSGNKKDPFDVYDWLNELHQQHQLNPVYFFFSCTKKKRR